MRKTILALATVGALTGTALPALAWDRDGDDNGYYRHRYYRNYDYRPYRRYDNDDYRRPYREHHRWWWRHRHHDYDYDRHYYRRYY
jgi:hypothetical protein